MSLKDLEITLHDINSPWPLREELFYWRRLVIDELHEPLRALRDAAGLRQDKKLNTDGRILSFGQES